MLEKKEDKTSRVYLSEIKDRQIMVGKKGGYPYCTARTLFYFLQNSSSEEWYIMEKTSGCGLPYVCTNIRVILDKKPKDLWKSELPKKEDVRWGKHVVVEYYGEKFIGVFMNGETRISANGEVYIINGFTQDCGDENVIIMCMQQLNGFKNLKSGDSFNFFSDHFRYDNTKWCYYTEYLEMNGE